MEKEDETLQLYKITASYAAASRTVDPFKITILEYSDVKDTGKNYMFDGKRLSKEKIKKINVEIFNPRLVKGHVYVEKEDIQAYKALLHEEILKLLNCYREELVNALQVIKKWPGEVETKVID